MSAALRAPVVKFVTLTALPKIFNWHENWTRFTWACVELESAKQFYRFKIKPYEDNDSGNATRLIRAVRNVEAQELLGWTKMRSE